MSKLLAIVDTGFSSEILNAKNILFYRDFGSKNQEHGTYVTKAILLINPVCKLALAGIDLDSMESLREALVWISSLRPSILNLSWVTAKRDQETMDLLNGMRDLGTEIICAKSKRFHWPWSEFTGVDGSQEETSLPSLGTRGSSIACAIRSAKLSLSPGQVQAPACRASQQINLEL